MACWEGCSLTKFGGDLLILEGTQFNACALSDMIASLLLASPSPMSMVSCQLLEKSTLPECLGSYLGFPVFFFLLKNNKASSHLRGGGGISSPHLILLLCLKRTYGLTSIFPEEVIISREMRSHLKFLDRKKKNPKTQGFCLSSTSQWQLEGNETLITFFLSGLCPPLCHMG